MRIFYPSFLAVWIFYFRVLDFLFHMFTFLGGATPEVDFLPNVRKLISFPRAFVRHDRRNRGFRFQDWRAYHHRAFLCARNVPLYGLPVWARFLVSFVCRVSFGNNGLRREGSVVGHGGVICFCLLLRENVNALLSYVENRGDLKRCFPCVGVLRCERKVGWRAYPVTGSGY